MGGSGGGYLGGKEPRELAEDLRRAEQKARGDALVVEVEAFLGQVLAGANDRDRDATAEHLDEIKAAIEGDTEDVVDLYFGGSVAKRTYVQGLSDVDALLVLNETELAGKKPRAVCAEVRERLESALSHAVSEDGFAITVHFPDIDVQVVPVIGRGENYLLPGRDLTDWERARPRAFADALTRANKECNGKVVPTIKLVKVLLSQLPESRRPSGYHLENLAVLAFEGYQGPYTPRAMLHRFFEQAPKLIREPIVDSTGQSRHVDDYLGERDSVQRLVTADALDRIGRRLRNADGSGEIGQWRRLFGEER